MDGNDPGGGALEGGVGGGRDGGNGSDMNLNN